MAGKEELRRSWINVCGWATGREGRLVVWFRHRALAPATVVALAGLWPVLNGLGTLGSKLINYSTWFSLESNLPEHNGGSKQSN